MSKQFELKRIAFKKFGMIYDGNKEAYETALMEINKGVLPADDEPLLRSAYPLKTETNNKLTEINNNLPTSVADVLQAESTGDSIVLEQDVQLPSSPKNNPDYWDVKPVYPEQRKFWNQLFQVVDLQIARKNNQDPNESYGWPTIMKEAKVDSMNAFTLEDIAAAVNGEYPASIQKAFIREEVFPAFKAQKNDARKNMLSMGQPTRSGVDFIGMQVRIAAINTWSFEVVAPVNFMLKWHYGMPRPEEVAWLIATDRISDGLEKTTTMKQTVELIKGMNLQQRKDFTAYNKEKEDGSPTHPSFPAMHSAGSTLSTWLPVLFKLTPEQYEQTLLIDHAVAFGRSVAGVHYPMDNIAGLNIGQRIVREELPAFVAEKYGYDEAKVEARLEKLSFDWKDFDSIKMTIRGQPVKDFFATANKGVKTIYEQTVIDKLLQQQSSSPYLLPDVEQTSSPPVLQQQSSSAYQLPDVEQTSSPPVLQQQA